MSESVSYAPAASAPPACYDPSPTCMMPPPLPRPLPSFAEESAFSRKRGEILSSAFTLPEFKDFRFLPIGSDKDKDFKNETKSEELDRFLRYESGFKKHKGKKWGEIIQIDYDYFRWIVTTRLDKSKKTYTVFSALV